MNLQAIQKYSSAAGEQNCIVCKSDSYKPLFYISPRRIVQCIDCGHEYVNPLPLQKDILECKFFPSDGESIGTLIDAAYLGKIFDKYDIREGKLLDLGCGEGRLERKIIEQGFAAQNITLMDNSKKNMGVVKSKYPSCSFIHGDIQDGIDQENYFDCILMVEFLEHLVNPAKALQNATNALRPGGLLIMRGLPNNKSIESFLGSQNWKMRQFEQHYHFFNKETFTQFAQNFPQLSILEFDTFLQEGYKFYDLAKIAKNIGIFDETKDHKPAISEKEIVSTNRLLEAVLAKIKNTNFEDYSNLGRINIRQLNTLSTAQNIEEFFNNAALDVNLSPDFSVVLRKEKK